MCNKNNRLLYKKQTAEDATTAGTWHLFDKSQHSDPEYSWDEACAKAQEGLTEGSKEIDIVLNERAEEVEPPTKIWWEKGKGKGKGKSGGGGGGGGGNRRRSRSRSHRRSRSKSHHRASSSAASAELALQPKGGTFLQRGPMHPMASEVLISKVELDHMIDCTARTAATCEHCAMFCKQATDVFENAAKAMKECKHTFERFRRA